MKRKAFVATALGASTVLTGCYIVPIDSHYPAQPGSIPAGAIGVGVPPPPAVNTLQARLYPLNETAGKMGAISASVVDSMNGRAVFSLSYAGETLQGEATRVAAGYPGFGNVHREVYGDGRMPSGQRGIASAAGTRGTYVNCEYALNAPSQGTGACLFSNGAKFQMHFGG